ncbi:MAG: ATP-binding protein [candidate division KSB1 bacterium]|nr:ATP-binding protein [candidate division KSB1 bacterium]
MKQLGFAFKQKQCGGELVGFIAFIRCCSVALLLAGFACSPAKQAIWQPDKQPSQFKSVLPIAGDQIFLADLDKNGFTEIIAVDTTIAQGQYGSFILLMTFEGKTIEQAIFAGRILEVIYTLDYNDDGLLEILVPFMRHDSLFVSLVSNRGLKLATFFLINGQPRIEDGGYFPWDPFVRGFYVRDLDQNGEKELITVITTGYARLPRGILVHSLQDGKRIGCKIVGSPPRDNFLDDFDGNGELEIICFGTAPDNGAVAGGFDDQHSYLITYELTPTPQIIRHQLVSSRFSNYWLSYTDMNGDGKKELLAWTECNSERITESKIVELNPVTFEEKKKWSYNRSLFSVITANLNRDQFPEIIALGSQREIIVLNNRFEEISFHRFPVHIHEIKNLSNSPPDGIDNIVVSSVGGDFLLNQQMRIRATFPEARCIGVVRRGDNLPPQLVLQGKNGFELGDLVPNRFYLFIRYSSWMWPIITTGLLIFLAVLANQLYLRCQLFNGIQSLVVESDPRGIVLFDHHLRIHQMNSTLQQWLAVPTVHGRHRRISDIFERFPDVVAFLEQTPSRPLRRDEKIVNITSNQKPAKFLIIVEPVPMKGRQKSWWLAIFLDQSRNEEIWQAKLWCQMAQKTAHDIKNPLTSIRLTLEHLQMYQQDLAPPVAEKFESGIKRIIERIESLRRISKNFMKFVNVDRLNPANTNLNEFLLEMVNGIRAGLPPDIQIDFKASANLPSIKIDQEAMQSVIENLVANAVNALPDGGKISVTTQFVEKLILPGNGSFPRDYALIEVLDTGIGIPEAELGHLFEPNFTRTEGGNGLGLAYVKKTIDDHQGYIEVASEPGAGTAFSLYLPVY